MTLAALNMASTVTLPHFRSRNGVQQLIVDGQPFLILGGELHNSSFSSPRYMKNIWPRLAESLNTVLGPVSWEQIEPEEDKFNFENVTELILDARRHGLRLILLWFGTWKNGLSSYVPLWMKKNPRRFARAKLSNPDGSTRIGDVLSPFSQETVRADAKAFGRLMEHLKCIDEGFHTVVMVQVENEVGLLGDSRDRSPRAEEYWKHDLPEDLMVPIREQWGSLSPRFRQKFPQLQPNYQPPVTAWADTSEDPLAANELFMGYHYAKYVEAVAQAGKSAYDLPLFTNVWQCYSSDTSDAGVDVPAIVAGGGEPGDYPCGAGVPHLLDLWQIIAPTLSFIAPDIYLNDYSMTCSIYTHRNQALFIPEQRRDEYGARRIWLAFGSYKCIGTAPFGIDTADLIDDPFRRHYALLKKVSSYVLSAQTEDRIVGFFFDEVDANGRDPSHPKRVKLGRWNLNIERSHVFGRPSAGCGIIILLPESETYLLVGWGFQLSFEMPGAEFVGILSFQEKECTAGVLTTLRVLNGDETRSGKVAVMPSADPDYGGFPISITIPAHTGIATVAPYALTASDL